MLGSESHRQPYHAFRAQVQQTKTALGQNDDQLRQEFQAVQPLFQQLLDLNPAELSPPEEMQVRSVQTEINKQMRLLGTDVLFLQAARQAATAEQRRQQMGDRLELLLRYCDMLLGQEQ